LSSTLVAELEPGRRPVEGPPAVELKVTTLGVGSDVTIYAVSTGSITPLTIGDSLFESRDTPSRVVGSERVPDSRWILREVPVDLALEGVGEERVGNVLWAVGGGDVKGLETNRVVDLTRRQVGCRIGPVPVWGAESEGGLDPVRSVGLILLGDLERSGLESLLQVEHYQYAISDSMVILTSYKAR
jgi:hypothetical protein